MVADGVAAREPERRTTGLSASSAVILGLLRQGGPKTIYDLSAVVSVSIGFFWNIPNSQMYAEAKRLESEGYVDVVREDFGRRRKVLHINDAGRQALSEWLATPTDEPVEIRDTGLLKLFFSDGEGRSTLPSLAADRLAYHRARLELYQQLQEAGFDGDWASRPVLMGLAYERISVDYWEQLLADLEP